MDNEYQYYHVPVNPINQQHDIYTETSVNELNRQQYPEHQYPGHQQGFQQGFRQGFRQGYRQGYRDGYRAGQQAGYYPGHRPIQQSSWPDESWYI